MSLPSNTSENLNESGVNLLGVDREIIPKNSMVNINKVADGGQWNLVKPDSSKFYQIVRDKFKRESNKIVRRNSA